MQPGSGGRLTDPRDRTANANSAFGMSRNAGRNLQTPAPQGTTNGGFVPPWRLDQNPSVYPSDPRDSGLWPRPDAGAGQNRRDLDRLDLNEDEHGDGDLPGGTTSFPAKGSLGNSRFASRTGSRPTQRGMLDDRDSVRHASATTGRGGSTNYAADDPRGATHQFAPTRTGMLGEQAVNKQVWWPLTMTLVLLFASFGGNLYLGWLALDFYRRYREAAWELRTSEGPLN